MCPLCMPAAQKSGPQLTKRRPCSAQSRGGTERKESHCASSRPHSSRRCPAVESRGRLWRLRGAERKPEQGDAQHNQYTRSPPGRCPHKHCVELSKYQHSPPRTRQPRSFRSPQRSGCTCPSSRSRTRCSWRRCSCAEVHGVGAGVGVKRRTRAHGMHYLHWVPHAEQVHGTSGAATWDSSLTGRRPWRWHSGRRGSWAGE